jgi:hypothetical protein
VVFADDAVVFISNCVLAATSCAEFKGCGVLPSDNLVLGERAAAAAAESKSAAVESKSTAAAAADAGSAGAGAAGAAGAAEGETKLRATDNLPIRRPGSESERVAALLAKYSAASSSATTADDSLLVACPWGNRFRLHTSALILAASIALVAR